MTKTFPYATLLLVVLIVLVIDLYVYEGIKTVTAKLSSRFQRKAIRRTYWVLNVGLMLTVAIGFMAFDRSKPPAIGLMRLLGFYFALLVPKLVYIIILAGEDVYRILRGIFKRGFHLVYPPEDQSAITYFPARRKFISQLALGVSALPFMSMLYGMSKGKYNFKLHRQTIYFPDLPEAFDGFTITQISDIHSGSFDDMEGVMKGIRMVNAQKSDLFVFTGDLVNNFAGEIVPWLDVFKSIEAPYGKYSILGNHDYGDYSSWKSMALKLENHEQLKHHHETLGYRLLLNEHVVLEKDNQKITLIGVENWGLGFKQEGDLPKALQGIDKDGFNILLSHDPSHWDAEVKKNQDHIHLTLSGHTHGMQFGIEIPGFKWSPIQMRYPKWAGLYEEKGKYLYVNRGFGFLGFPGRVGIWPEVTVLTLKKGIVLPSSEIV